MEEEISPSAGQAAVEVWTANETRRLQRIRLGIAGAVIVVLGLGGAFATGLSVKGDAGAPDACVAAIHAANAFQSAYVGEEIVWGQFTARLSGAIGSDDVSAMGDAATHVTQDLKKPHKDELAAMQQLNQAKKDCK
jgi:hypothetical protein